jgi:hypothetical protein
MRRGTTICVCGHRDSQHGYQAGDDSGQMICCVKNCDCNNPQIDHTATREYDQDMRERAYRSWRDKP